MFELCIIFWRVFHLAVYNFYFCSLVNVFSTQLNVKLSLLFTVFPADPELARRILRLVQSSFLDGSYQTEQYWTVASIQKIKSPHLERTYWLVSLSMVNGIRIRF